MGNFPTPEGWTGGQPDARILRTFDGHINEGALNGAGLGMVDDPCNERKNFADADLSGTDYRTGGK